MPISDRPNAVMNDDLYIQKLEQLRAASAEKVEQLKAMPQYTPMVLDAGPIAKDLAIKAAQGVVDVGQSIVGLGSLATGGLVGQGMRAIGYDPEAANQFLGQYLSPEQQAADLKVQQAQGFMETIRASLENPRSILGSVVESLPGMAAGMGVTAGVARGIAAKAALATVEGEAAASTVLKAGGSAAKASEAALSTKAGAEAAQAAINAAETRLLITGAAGEGAQSAGQIADQAQGAGRSYSDYALPAIAAGVGTAGINLLAGKLMGSAETDIAAGTHTLKGGFLTKVAKEGFSEGVLEEMPQSAQEQIFTNIAMGKPWDEGVGNAAASGLLAGAAMGAGMGGLHHPAEVREQKAVLTQQEVQEKATTVVEAVQKGDPSTLLNQDSKSYDPVAAVSVLRLMNKKADTTEEDRTNNVESAFQIVSNLNDQRDKLVQQAKTANKSESKRLMREAKDVHEQMMQAQAVWDAMTDELVSKPVAEQVKTQVQLANNQTDQGITDPVAQTAAANNVIQLATQTAEALSPKDAINLASNMDNGLSMEERNLLRAFSEARVASNALKDGTKVQQEIFYGSDKNIGLSQYRERIGKAIVLGAQQVAQAQLGMLSRFAEDHMAKAQAAREALSRYGLGAQVHKTADGRWIVADPKDYFTTESQRQKNGGWIVKSARGVQEFEQEAKALAATRDEMAQAMALRFGQGSVQSSTPTPAPTAPQSAPPVSPSASEENTAPQGKSLSKEMGKEGARLENGSPESVVGAPHSTNNSQENITGLEGVVSTTSSLSSAPAPSSQPSAPIAVAGAPAQGTAASSAPVAGTSQETQQAAAAGPAAVSAANPAPARKAAPAEGNKNANQGGSADGRLLASRKEVTALQEHSRDPVYKGHYDSTDYRTLTLDELHALKAALDKVIPGFKEELGQVRFAAFAHATRKGTMFDAHHMVALNQELFKPANQDLLVHVIAHELAHLRDANNGWASEHAATLQPGGAIYEAAKTSIAGSTVLDQAFGYIFKGDKYTGNAVPRELFAQLHALYLTKPEYFNEGQPLALAGQALRGNQAGNPENSRRVDEGQSIPDRAGSAETGAASTDTEGTSQPRQPAVTADPEAPQQSSSTGLKLFAQKLKDLPGKINQAFRVVGFNAIAQFLEQKQDNERYQSARPLVVQENFLSTWAKDPHKVYGFLQEYISGQMEPGKHDEHERALDSLYGKLVEWNSLLPQNLVYSQFKGKPEDVNLYRYADPIQFLLDEHGRMEENALTAMSAAMYQWVLAQSQSPELRDAGAINALHGRDQDEYLHPDGEEHLRTVAGFEDQIISSLGSLAIDALGFKASKNAPQDFLPRLKNSVGTQLLLLLEKQGYIERVAFKQSQVKEWLGQEDSQQITEGEAQGMAPKSGEPTYLSYVRFRHDKAEVRDIKVSNQGTGSLVEQLFGSEQAPRMAGTKPVKFTQQVAKGTQQEISDVQREAIQETMNTPHKVIPAVHAAITALGKEWTLKIAGWTNVDKDAGPVHVHAVNQKGAAAQNQNLESQWDLAFDMLDYHGTDAEFYVEQHVGKNFRAYFSNRSLNQQTSKLHRILFARPEWNVTIDLNNADLVNEYKVAIAMSLGDKTDSRKNAVTLGQFDSWWQGEKQADLRAAVAVLQKDSTTWTEQDRETVSNAAASREGMMSLQAMISYAQYLTAVENKESSFPTTLLVGVDGKTNGPMLTHLALGAADDLDQFYALLNRGGFYSTDADQAEHYGDWYGRGGNQDLYENLGADIINDVQSKLVSDEDYGQLLDTAIKLPKGSKEAGQAWKAFFKHFTHAQLAAIEATTKQLLDRDKGIATKAMRSLTKVPLTSFAFGSALKKSIQGMQAHFVAEYYATLQRMASGEDKGSLSQYLDQINTLIEMGHKGRDKPWLNVNMPLEVAMQTRLSPEQVKALNAAFDRIIGRSVKGTMDRYFATFQGRRQAINSMVAAGYETFEAAYAAAKVEEMKRLMADGEIVHTVTRNGELKPLHDMTVVQEQALRRKLQQLLPVMHSEYSQTQNSLAHGLYMAKSEIMTAKSQLYATTGYTQQPVERPIDGMTGERLPRKDDKPVYRLASKPQAWTEKGPGVIGGSYPIHSGDSSIMHNTLRKVKQTLNVHDEGSNSVVNARAMARALNESTAQTFLHYSPMREALHMMERQVTHMAAMIKAGSLDPAVVHVMAGKWAEIHNRGLPEEEHITASEALQLTLQDAVGNAFRADYMRLSAFAKLKTVDQYVWEGGQFEVTQAMRDLAQQRLDALSTELQPGTSEALAYLEQVMMDNPAKDLDPHQWLNIEREEDYAEKQAAPKTGMTPAQQGTLQDAIGAREGDVEALIKAEMLAQGLISPWGELGAPTNPSNPRLVQAFESKPVMSTREVLKELRRQVGREPLQGLYTNLIGLMERYLPDMEVRYVTKATPVNEVLEGADKSRGWYVSKGGQQAVYLLSPEHKMGQLTVETVLHELLHAGLARTIEGELKKAGTSAAYKSEKLALVHELEALLYKAREYARKNGITGFEEALKDVHEFASWGLTNKAFQDQVVSQISLQSKTGKTSLVQGMKEFIKTVANLLFFGSDKSRQARAVNGLQLLTANVAGLYSQAAKADSRITVVNRMAAQPNLRTYSTQDIFTALPSNRSISQPFEEKLRGVLDGIVGKLFGPMGSFREAIMRDSPQLPEDILQHAMQEGAAPFASKIMAAGFLMSDREAFVAEQVEATVRAAFDANEGQTAAPHRELARLYEEARKTVRPQDLYLGDWSQASQSEQDHAKALHAFVFKVEQGADKRSDYLSRFAALGLASEQFAHALGFQTEIRNESMSGMSLSQRLYAIFEKVLSWVNGKLTSTFSGQMADAKLTNLVQQLVTIEAKKRNKINARQMKVIGVAEDVLKNMAEGTRKKVAQFAGSPFFRNSSNAFVRSGGKLVATVAGDRVGEMMRNINAMRNSLANKKRGVLMGLFDEVRGANAGNLPFHILLRMTKVIEVERKRIITAVGNATRSSFDQGGSYLSDRHDAAITAVALRGDLGSLLGPNRYDMAGLTELVKDPAKLKAAIQGLEQQLQQFGNFQHYYQKQARGLAWHKIEGGAKVVEQMFNAGNIARAYGTPYSMRVSESQAHAAEAIIDPLVSLYALQYSSREKKALLAEVMDREAARTDGGNGLQMVLLTHQQLQQESRDRLFNGTEALRMKGYVPEIYNPHIEVVVASGEEADMLKKIGYSEQVENLAMDPADRGDTRRLFVYRDGGLQSYQSGIVSTTGMNSRGSLNYNGDAATIQSAKAQAVRDLFKADPNFDPAKVKNSLLAPIVNPQGEVVDYRYMMTELNKDTLLERHNGFDKILGQMAGNIFDKEKSTDQNRKAVEALKSQFDEEFQSKPQGYVVVGPNSTDPELRNIWRLFPEAMKQDIREVWGNNNMRVRADLLDINFGYRKLSLANVFDKDNVERNLAGKLLQDMLVHILKEDDTEAGREVGRRKAQLKVRMAENIWQELVKMAKENMVLKSVTTLMGNFRSNVILLLWSGVNPADLIRHHRVAVKGALAYRRDNTELIQLKLARDAGYLQGQDAAEMTARIVRLEDAIARNPVKPLIDAGMMPTIVEDVSADDDLYSYRSRYTRGLEQKIEEVAGSINPHVRNAFDFVMLAKDTPLYKAMSYGTQLSDFVARYTLYQHLTTREKNRIAPDAALNRVSEAFVNYDIPSHRKVQYANDMGLVYFTKYYLRIQKVLVQLYRENPGRAMLMLAAGHYFDTASELTNSSVLHHIGNNPLSTGAFKAITTLDDTAVIKGALSVFR